MVFLTSVDIVDTGFLSRSTRTNQLATSLRVNSGSAIRLKGLSLEFESSANVDDESFVGDLTGSVDAPLVSVNSDTFTLTIYVNSSNVDTSNVWGVDDMQNLAYLFNLPKTRGFKAMYYPVVRTAVTTRQQDRQVFPYIGVTDTVQSQGDIDLTLANGETTTVTGRDLTDVWYIPCRFKTCKINRDSKSSAMRIVLTGVFVS